MSLIPFAGAVQKFNRDREYKIERSLRFNSADSTYLNRTPASAGNRKTWTWSGWVKRTNLGFGEILGSYTASNDNSNFEFRFTSSDQLQITLWSGSTTTTSVYRDVSAWYHIVLTIDTTSASNKCRLWVNGVEVTAFAADYVETVSLNADLGFNTAAAQYIGRWYISDAGGYFFNGYLTEINFIDGQALDPTSFGNFNPITGVWQPKKYAGEYGTNGFYLNFSDNSTVDALGTDFSGNDNTWSDNGFSVTAGAGNDSLVDTPTPYGTDTGVGGEVRGNYCTWNSAAQSTVANGTVTRSNGNLDSTDGGTTYSLASFGTISVTSGKWYWEITVTAAGGASGAIGIIDTAKKLIGGTASDAHFGFTYGMNGNKTDGRTYGGTVFSTVGVTAYGATYTTNDVLGVAMDLDEGTLTFYKNGVSQGVAFTGISGQFTPAVGDGANATSYTWTLNAGQRPFAYTAPSGFKALCTQNLPEPTIVDGSEYFDVATWTGDGVSPKQVVTSLKFQPDFIWDKSRSRAGIDHSLYDSVRGVGSGKVLSSDATNAEGVNDAIYGFVSSINSNGFTTTAGSTNNWFHNFSGDTYVAWNWKANGAGVENTDGTITSTVSANPDSGFSIVTYTGTGVAATIGHGLGVAPSMVITKVRSTSNNWGVYHSGINDPSKALLLDSTAAAASYGGATGMWNNTAPTSTVFSVGTNGSTGASATYVAYCFAAIPGYSAFGSYTGNGSADGPFIYLGFRPKFVMFKSTGVQDWVILDSARDTYNVAGNYLRPNSSGAENSGSTPTTSTYEDFLSNGIKLRNNASSSGYNNTNGVTYIYAAFSEAAFKYSLAR